MAHTPVSPQAIEDQIRMIEEHLRLHGPTYPDRRMYEDMLEENYQSLGNARRHGSSTVAGPSGSRSHLSSASAVASPVSAASSAQSRKRSLDPTATNPEPKRVSRSDVTSLTPDTPNSISSDNASTGLDSYDFDGHQSLPGRDTRVPIIDLTLSDPPTPDPFPELDNAFQPGVPQPADAFNQEWMTVDELAQFLVDPSSATPQYGVQHQMASASQVKPEVPYLPGSYHRPWAPSDESEDYGDFPLSVPEVEAVEKLLENISAHKEESPERREQTPRIMRSQLKEYQKIGLTWLIKMENGNSKGGILADGMGLGKTVQALSLICARPSSDPLRKTTLIIAPVALMRQWEKEIERHVHPVYKLKVWIYHGKGKSADFHKLRQYDVVLTTFGTLTSEYKQKQSGRESTLHEAEQRDPTFRRKAQAKLALLGHECMWYRIIIDEAQCIKNRNSLSSKAAHELMATHRLVMTGTPMMNSIDELFPLLRFLKIKPYNDWHRFNQEIGKPLKATHTETRKKAMQRVQILLQSIMLRRQKDSVVDGQVVCTIPPKHTNREDVTFSEEEQELYKALETKSQLTFNKYLEKGTVSANYANVLVLLLRLRQACCHPHLIKDLSQPATEGIAEADLLTRAQELADDVVTRLKLTESFECPICFEVDVNPTIIVPCGHTICGECVQKLVDPTNAIRDGNEDGGVAKCPHCRGELKASRITDYKHFCKVFCPEKLHPDDLLGDEEVDGTVSSDSDDEDESEDDDEADEKGNLAGFVVSDEDEDDDEKDDDDDDDDDKSQTNETESAHNKTKRKGKSKSKGKGKGRGKGKGKGKARAEPKKTLAQLKKDSLKNKAAKAKYLRRLRKTWMPSAKIEKTMEILDEITENDPTEKILIFSQFTSLLDLLEVPISDKKMRYQRYDGSMKMSDRADAVDKFMDDKDEKIMLLSLKAGNAGLNLAKASQVILLDPFWNPFVEEQAVDRAHRMPQPREVTVHRVLVPETVEDRIIALQDKKRDLIEAALDENTGRSLTRLNVQELRYLFGMGS